MELIDKINNGCKEFDLNEKKFSVSGKFNFNFRSAQPEKLSKLAIFTSKALVGDWENFAVSGGSASSGRAVTIERIA